MRQLLPGINGAGGSIFACLALCTLVGITGVARAQSTRPNILFAISDDQSFPHASAYGAKGVNTPAFDEIARRGVLFTNAFCGSPGCSPCRASLLTGRYPWQIEHAGTHASSFPSKYVVYPDLLEQNGYFVGYTGKGWGPGNWKISGRTRNPAGPVFNKLNSNDRAASGASRRDYAANFADFLEDRPQGQPFCFWFGGHEPHRGFEAGSGKRQGKQLADAQVPGFLPDTDEIRSDLLDYYLEIEHFDKHLGRMIKRLKESGELDRTLIVVTSDNGMAFPRAKANCYEFGIHAPLAIAWPDAVSGGRVVNDLVSFVDFAPTFLEVAGVKKPDAMIGRSLAPLLKSGRQGLVDPERDAVFSSRERHSSSRYNNLAYPQRAMRTQQYLLIRNFRPERWPAGAPQKLNAEGKLGPMHGAYHDIDACPSLSFLIKSRDDPKLGRFLTLAVQKRPALELFDIRNDPDCLHNLAGRAEYAAIQDELATSLDDYLRKTGDPRVLDGGDIFESYKRYSAIRKFPPPDNN